jgi:hypothetical protein
MESEQHVGNEINSELSAQVRNMNAATAAMIISAKTGVVLKRIAAVPAKNVMAAFTSVFAAMPIIMPFAATPVEIVSGARFDREITMASTSARPASALEI